MVRVVLYVIVLHTFGILITRCPVVFDRSAVERLVFTSSGKANCKTFEMQSAGYRMRTRERLTFPLMVTRTYVGCTSVSTSEVSICRKTATSRITCRLSSLSYSLKSTLHERILSARSEKEYADALWFIAVQWTTIVSDVLTSGFRLGLCSARTEGR